MRVYKANPNRKIPFGKQGENDAAKVIFPIEDLINIAGQGGIVSVMLRYNETGETATYTLTPSKDGTAAELHITSDMLRTVGTGVLQLKYQAGDNIAYSDMYAFEVMAALSL